MQCSDVTVTNIVYTSGSRDFIVR